jgi:hypothetical protein
MRRHTIHAAAYKALPLLGRLLLILPLQIAAESPMFERHVIDTFPAGYQVAVADLNGDGRLDVIGLSTDANRVDWFENPSWKVHPIARTARNIDLSPRDLDGDGMSEIALASGFYFSESTRGGEVQWLERPGDSTNLWRLHPIAVDPVVHRLRWGDLDGDGRPELVHAPLFGPESQNVVAPRPCHLWAFCPPANLRAGSWRVWKIDETLTVLHGIHVSDLDLDRRDEILTASFEGIHRFDFVGQGGNAHWEKMQISRGAEPSSAVAGAPRGSSEVAPGRLGTARAFVAAIEPWHGELVVVYTQTNSSSPWRRQVLDHTLKEGHALVVVDLDGDRHDEIVAGWRGSRGGIALYRAMDAAGQQWEKRLLDQGIAVEGLAVADLNRDGRLDLVAIAGRSNLLVWYEQRY